MIDPRLPDQVDPFNTIGCKVLPFPLTTNEDITLKYILRIASSDDQMFDRAYEAIVCMWAKRVQTITPVANSIWPVGPVIIGDIVGAYVQLFIYGTNIDSGANILYKGKRGMNPVVDTGDGFGGIGSLPRVHATMDFTDLAHLHSETINVHIVNSTNVISNTLTLQISVQPAV